MTIFRSKDGDKYWMTLTEVAEITRRGRQSVYRWARQGRLGALKVSGRWLFPRDKVLELVSNEREEYRWASTDEKGQLSGGSGSRTPKARRYAKARALGIELKP